MQPVFAFALHFDRLVQVLVYKTELYYKKEYLVIIMDNFYMPVEDGSYYVVLSVRLSVH